MAGIYNGASRDFYASPSSTAKTYLRVIITPHGANLNYNRRILATTIHLTSVYDIALRKGPLWKYQSVTSFLTKTPTTRIPDGFLYSAGETSTIK